MMIWCGMASSYILRITYYADGLMAFTARDLESCETVSRSLVGYCFLTIASGEYISEEVLAIGGGFCTW